MDPADVRKVMLDEPPGNLDANNPLVIAARETLFGSWEGNWVAYNDAHDVALPGSVNGDMPFLMYPVGESSGTRFSTSLEPDQFRYKITSREV